MTDMADSPYVWHVASAMKGMGNRPGTFVYHVQRYTRPEDGRRYTGDVATRTWQDRAQAQGAADLANAGPAPFQFRGTYL